MAVMDEFKEEREAVFIVQLKYQKLQRKIQKVA